MEISRYIVHRTITAEAVPAVVMRRAVRELLVLAKIEQERTEDLDLGTAGPLSAMPSMPGSPGTATWTDRPVRARRRAGRRFRSAPIRRAAPRRSPEAVMARLVRRTLRCTPAEKAAIRERAEAAGMPVSRFLVAFALHEDAGGPPARNRGWCSRRGNSGHCMSGWRGWTPSIVHCTRRFPSRTCRCSARSRSSSASCGRGASEASSISRAGALSYTGEMRHM